MSDTSSLSELARFVGRSALLSDNATASGRAVNDIVHHMVRRPPRQRVSDLLSVVLTLSARTRRMMLPRVDIDLDVFAPGGQRAVRIYMPE
jgi:hypothetical protein